MGLQTRTRAQRSGKGTHTHGHHVTGHAWSCRSRRRGVLALRGLSQVASGQLSRGLPARHGSTIGHGRM